MARSPTGQNGRNGKGAPSVSPYAVLLRIRPILETLPSLPQSRGATRAASADHSIPMRILILHGMLHLMGYDHETDAGQMDRRERQLRRELGLA